MVTFVLLKKKPVQAKGTSWLFQKATQNFSGSLFGIFKSSPTRSKDVH